MTTLRLMCIEDRLHGSRLIADRSDTTDGIESSLRGLQPRRRRKCQFFPADDIQTTGLQCRNSIMLNPFAINADWRPIAATRNPMANNE